MHPTLKRVMVYRQIGNVFLIASLGLAISACSTRTATEPAEPSSTTEVVEPPTITPQTLTTSTIEPVVQRVFLAHNPDLSGNIGSGGEIFHLEIVGDRSNNVTSQAFLTFELSGLPQGATLTHVGFDFSASIVNGHPFQDLGCLQVYVDPFGEVDSVDYVVSPSNDFFLEMCEEEQLLEYQTADQWMNQLVPADDAAILQIRMQFEDTSDNDGIVDAIEILSAILLIEYLH
jgi:hypothetical protein